MHGRLQQGHQERLYQAACWRDYQLGVAERALAQETAQIEAEYAGEAAQMREGVLAALLEQRQALLEEKERLAAQASEQQAAPPADAPPPAAAAAEDGAARAKRSLRSAAQAKKDDASRALSVPLPPTVAPTKRRAQAGTNCLGMLTMLPENEIYEDLNAISRGGGLGDDAAGRRNAPRAQAKPAAAKRRGAAGAPLAADDALMSSPARPSAKRSLKDLSAPADETISNDDDSHMQDMATDNEDDGTDDDAEDADADSVEPAHTRRKRSADLVADEPAPPRARKNSAEDKDIAMDSAAGTFYYCGAKYGRGSEFTMAFGRDLGKSLDVTLIQVGQDDIQVRKTGDGVKMKVSLEDLVTGAVMILQS